MDVDRDGLVDFPELCKALDGYGFSFPPTSPIPGLILRRYAMNGKITFSSFVALIIRLTALSGEWMVSTTATMQRLEKVWENLHDYCASLNSAVAI